MIRVGLVDDQSLVRTGIKTLLEMAPDITVVFEAQDGLEALAFLAETTVEVLLLDVRMPKLDGLGVLKALQAKPYQLPTLVLTTFDDDGIVLEAIQYGAKGYLLKDVSLEQLLEAVRTLASGGQHLQPAITTRVLQALQGKSHSNSSSSSSSNSTSLPDPLTERELEVLRLMAGGYSNKEIANAYHLSEGTIKNHVSNLLSKLGVRDRTRAVLKAIEIGLI
jgi:DNA-binding NarL/FixJ family response regulator